MTSQCVRWWRYPETIHGEIHDVKYVWCIQNVRKYFEVERDRHSAWMYVQFQTNPVLEPIKTSHGKRMLATTRQMAFLVIGCKRSTYMQHIYSQARIRSLTLSPP